jgi:hypothetical protein
LESAEPTNVRPPVDNEIFGAPSSRRDEAPDQHPALLSETPADLDALFGANPLEQLMAGDDDDDLDDDDL